MQSSLLCMVRSMCRVCVTTYKACAQVSSPTQSSQSPLQSMLYNTEQGSSHAPDKLGAHVRYALAEQPIRDIPYILPLHPHHQLIHSIPIRMGWVVTSAEALVFFLRAKLRGPQIRSEDVLPYFIGCIPCGLVSFPILLRLLRKQA